MTLEHDLTSAELFGLADTFPRPGWSVLDAARSHGFTGELTFDTIPPTKVYLDSGEIYLAERVTDPPLGSRLVDAGALNAAQLEHGLMYVGEIAHLGRLFERVPSVNRHNVLLVTEMMTEECVGWLAGQLVRDAVAAPYHHHPAGIQRWLRPVPAVNPESVDELPSPTLEDAHVELVADERSFSPVEPLDEGMIEWEHPSWLDEQGSGQEAASDSRSATDRDPAVALAEPTLSTDVPERSQPIVPGDEVVDDVVEPFEFVTADDDPWVEPVAPADEMADEEVVEPFEFVTADDERRVEPVAPAESPAEPADEVSWLTTPPTFAEPTALTGEPLAAPTGFADPGLPAPEPQPPVVVEAELEPGVEVELTQPEPIHAEPSEPVPAVREPEPEAAQTESPEPEPAAPSDDWAELVAAVAEAETDPAALASDQTIPAHDQAPPVAQVDSLDAAAAPVTSIPAEPADARLPVPQTAGEQDRQIESSHATDHVPVEPEVAPMVLPVRPTRPVPEPAPAAGDEQLDAVPEFEDWVDQLDTKGLPDAGTDLLGTTKRLPPTSAPPPDRFEVIWPSGEVDEQFGSLEAPPTAGQPDLDRVGATARLKSGVADPTGPEAAFDQAVDEPSTGDEVTDEVVLAVRRAVATIETGSLAARRRLVTTPPTDDPSRGVDRNSERVLTPLRHDSTAVEHAMRPATSSVSHRAPTRSVFDDDLPVVAPAAESVPSESAPVAHEAEPTRSGALRRLIGSLRRH